MSSQVRVLAIVVMACLQTTRAEADVKGAFREAWKCMKSVPGSLETLGKDIIAKGEAVASVSASIGTCAASGGSPEMLAFATATLGTIKASTNLLPNGQCKKRIHGAVAKPFALGLALILPDGSIKKKILQLVESEEAASQVWGLVKMAPPPFRTIPDQLDCACDMIEAGVTLADASAVANVIKNTSKACAGILDEVGLGFLNDWGSAAIAWLGGAYKTISGAWQGLQGKKDPAPDEAVYQGFFGAYVPFLATSLATEPPNTLPDTIRLTNAADGWANLSPTSYASGFKMDLAYLKKECESYYGQKKFGAGMKPKCNDYKIKAAAAAVKDAGRLRHQGTAITVFRLQLYKWLEQNWLWRLPPCDYYGPENLHQHAGKGDQNGCNLTQQMANDRWKVGTFKENKTAPWQYSATGIYAQAREALIQSGYNDDLAHKATLAGAEASVRAKTLAMWNDAGVKANVRYRWLPKLMPTPAMTSKYGCTGALSAECTSVIEKTFESVCHPMIRDAFVLPPDVLGVAGKLGGAKETCKKTLESIVKNTTNLQEAGMKAVQTKAAAKCPTPARDRAKSGACVAKLTASWEACAKPQVGNVLGSPVGTATQCFDKATQTLTFPGGPGGRPAPTGPAGRGGTPRRP